MRFLHVFAKNAVNWSPCSRLTEQNPEHLVFCPVSLLPCFSICIHQLGATTWHAQFCRVAQLPFFRFTSASSSFIGIYFRFLIFYWYLLPFPHLLFVSVYLLVVSVYLLVVSVYLLVVSVYDIDVFAHITSMYST